MDKPEALLTPARIGSKLCNIFNNDALESFPADIRTSETAKRHELLRLLSDLPEESDSERELSFSFLVNNESSKLNGKNNDTKNDDSSKTEEPRKVTSETKEKPRKRRNSISNCGGSKDGVLLNLFVPASVKRSESKRRDNRKPARFTIAELENRDTNLGRGFGCWSALLAGRQHRTICSNAI